MFEHTKAFSGFSADDIPAARKFYSETLGIPVSEEHGILTLHIAGDRDTIVYPKTGHVPATFTILNFPVSDIEAAVDELDRQGASASSRRTTTLRPTPRASTGRAARSSPGSRTRPATSSR